MEAEGRRLLHVSCRSGARKAAGQIEIRDLVGCHEQRSDVGKGA